MELPAGTTLEQLLDIGLELRITPCPTDQNGASDVLRLRQLLAVKVSRTSLSIGGR